MPHIWPIKGSEPSSHPNSFRRIGCPSTGNVVSIRPLFYGPWNPVGLFGAYSTFGHSSDTGLRLQLSFCAMQLGANDEPGVGTRNKAHICHPGIVYYRLSRPRVTCTCQGDTIQSIHTYIHTYFLFARTRARVCAYVSLRAINVMYQGNVSRCVLCVARCVCQLHFISFIFLPTVNSLNGR